MVICDFPDAWPINNIIIQLYSEVSRIPYHQPAAPAAPHATLARRKPLPVASTAGAMPRASTLALCAVLQRFIGWEWTVQAFYTSVAKALTPSGVVSVQVKARTACKADPKVQPPEGPNRSNVRFVHHASHS